MHTILFVFYQIHILESKLTSEPVPGEEVANVAEIKELKDKVNVLVYCLQYNDTVYIYSETSDSGPSEKGTLYYKPPYG